MNDTITDNLVAYGVPFDGEQGPYQPGAERITLNALAARGGRIVRVRWIGGDYVPGRGKCYDLSYVQGAVTDADGNEVRVDVHVPNAAHLIPRRRLKGAMIEWARDEGVYAKDLGLLDDGNYSILG